MIRVGKNLAGIGKLSYLCIVKTSIKRVKSRMIFELFRAKKVSSESSQNKQHLSDKRKDSKFNNLK